MNRRLNKTTVSRSVLASVLLLIVSTSIIGCSNYKGAYQSIQITEKQKCYELPLSEQQGCIERLSKPYEEYERDRQAL